MRASWIAALIAAVFPLAACAGATTVQVDADIPAGNIVVDKIDGNDVYVHQDLRDTKGHWFYWHFRVRGAEGRTLTFHFTNKGNVLGARGPAVSTDGGSSWRWLGTAAVRGQTFSFAFPADARDVRFCVTFPYTEHDLRAFLARYAGNPHLKVEPLARTKKGRDVMALRLGRVDGKAAIRVALTCRHHACETMASFELEGIIEAVLADTPHGKWLRENVEFFIVPIMDLDGVEDGDQGKNRAPYDHNRDYVASPSIYPQVAALRERLPAWSDRRLRVALDLHCPELLARSIYFVGGPNEAVWKETGRFCTLLEKVQTGPLVYRPADNLPYGKGWNSKMPVGQNPFSRWAAELPGVAVASTIELPYADVRGQVVNESSARAFGRDVAVALHQYLDPSK